MTKTAIMTGILLLLLLACPSTAEIKTLTITSDTRPMILFEKYGFTHTGQVFISVSSVSVVAPPSSSSQPDPSRFGFFLLSQESLLQVLIEIQQKPYFCLLDSHYIIKLFTFRNLSPPPSASTNRTSAIKIPDEYSLFFANCVPETSVSMTVHTELYDLDFDKDYFRNYLSYGQRHLPSIFLCFSIAYFTFFTLFLYQIHVSKHSLHSVHLLMAFLLLAKAISLICDAKAKLSIKITGTPHGWDVFFFVFDFVHVVLLFTVIMLMGTRWIFLQPLVRKRGQKMLFLIIPLQVLAYVVHIVVHNAGPYIKDWVTLNQVMLFLDFISWFSVVLIFVWNVRSLRKICVGSSGLSLKKVRLIKRFYCVVGGYFFLTRFVLSALGTVFDREKQWVNNLVQETITLVFCIIMFCAFRLAEKDEFSLIAEEEEQVVQIVVTK